MAAELPANPNSATHASGMHAANVLAKAAADVAEFVGATEDATRFVPSASSALWLALEDAIARRGNGMRVLASSIEHPSLMRHLEKASRDGTIALELFRVDGRGQPDLARLAEMMSCGRVDMLCMMAANNEIGTIAPVDDILGLAQRCGALTLIDASQAAGRYRISAITASADYVVASGAKMNGPRRVGVLVGHLTKVVSGRIEAMFGTPDAAAASAMALACSIAAAEMGEDASRIRHLRDRLESILIDGVPGLVVNGDTGSRLDGALHVSSPAIGGDALVARMWGEVAVSTGAACQSGVPGPSHVLTAMGLEDWISEGAVRICVGKFNDQVEIDRAGSLLAEAMVAAHQARRRHV